MLIDFRKSGRGWGRETTYRCERITSSIASLTFLSDGQVIRLSFVIKFNNSFIEIAQTSLIMVSDSGKLNALLFFMWHL